MACRALMVSTWFTTGVTSEKEVIFGQRKLPFFLTDSGNCPVGWACGISATQLFGTTSSIGISASFQAIKPPAMWQTFSIPICCTVWVANADRQAAAQ